MPQGLRTPGNINLWSRPHVKNADGSMSTVRSMSFGDNQGETLIPTVSNDGRIMGEEEAIQEYRHNGQHLGIFDTPENATAYAEQLHNDYAAGKYDVPLATSRRSVSPSVLGAALDGLQRSMKGGQ